MIIELLLAHAPYLKEQKNKNGKMPFDVSSGNRDVKNALRPLTDQSITATLLSSG